MCALRRLIPIESGVPERFRVSPRFSYVLSSMSIVEDDIVLVEVEGRVKGYRAQVGQESCGPIERRGLLHC